MNALFWSIPVLMGLIVLIGIISSFFGQKEEGKVIDLNSKLKEIDDSVKLMYNSDIVKSEMVQDLRSEVKLQKQMFTVHIQQLEKTIDALSNRINRKSKKKEKQRKAN